MHHGILAVQELNGNVTTTKMLQKFCKPVSIPCLSSADLTLPFMRALEPVSPRLVIPEGVDDPLSRRHDERAVLHDLLLERSARDHNESHLLVGSGLERDACRSGTVREHGRVELRNQVRGCRRLRSREQCAGQRVDLRHTGARSADSIVPRVRGNTHESVPSFRNPLEDAVSLLLDGVVREPASSERSHG